MLDAECQQADTLTHMSGIDTLTHMSGISANIRRACVGYVTSEKNATGRMENKKPARLIAPWHIILSTSYVRTSI